MTSSRRSKQEQERRNLRPQSRPGTVEKREKLDYVGGSLEYSTSLGKISHRSTLTVQVGWGVRSGILTIPTH
jgi:hypothetical protein